MRGKLDRFSQDIIALLEKSKPKVLLWREIKRGLEPKHRKRYKSDHVYGVALTNKLTQLLAKGLIARAGDHYGAKSSVKLRRMAGGDDKPKAHVMDIAQGLLALIDGSKYRLEGKLYPDPKFMKPALQHIRTGYLEIYDLAIEMHKSRSASPKDSAKKTDDDTRYKQAWKRFTNEADLLVERLKVGIDKLEGSYCEICEGFSGETIDDETKAEIEELLRDIWNANA